MYLRGGDRIGEPTGVSGSVIAKNMVDDQPVLTLSMQQPWADMFAWLMQKHLPENMYILDHSATYVTFRMQDTDLRSRLQRFDELDLEFRTTVADLCGRTEEALLPLTETHCSTDVQPGDPIIFIIHAKTHDVRPTDTEPNIMVVTEDAATGNALQMLVDIGFMPNVRQSNNEVSESDDSTAMAATNVPELSGNQQAMDIVINAEMGADVQVGDHITLEYVVDPDIYCVNTDSIENDSVQIYFENRCTTIMEWYPTQYISFATTFFRGLPVLSITPSEDTLILSLAMPVDEAINLEYHNILGIPLDRLWIVWREGEALTPKFTPSTDINPRAPTDEITIDIPISETLYHELQVGDGVSTEQNHVFEGVCTVANLPIYDQYMCSQVSPSVRPINTGMAPAHYHYVTIIALNSIDGEYTATLSTLPHIGERITWLLKHNSIPTVSRSILGSTMTIEVDMDFHSQLNTSTYLEVEFSAPYEELCPLPDTGLTDVDLYLQAKCDMANTETADTIISVFSAYIVDLRELVDPASITLQFTTVNRTVANWFISQGYLPSDLRFASAETMEEIRLQTTTIYGSTTIDIALPQDFYDQANQGDRIYVTIPYDWTIACQASETLPSGVRRMCTYYETSDAEPRAFDYRFHFWISERFVRDGIPMATVTTTNGNAEIFNWLIEQDVETNVLFANPERNAADNSTPNPTQSSDVGATPNKTPTPQPTQPSSIATQAIDFSTMGTNCPESASLQTNIEAADDVLRNNLENIFAENIEISYTLASIFGVECPTLEDTIVITYNIDVSSTQMSDLEILEGIVYAFPNAIVDSDRIFSDEYTTFFSAFTIHFSDPSQNASWEFNLLSLVQARQQELRGQNLAVMLDLDINTEDNAD